MTTGPDDAVAHYERLLAEHYAWMLGDFDAAMEEQRALLVRLDVERAGDAAPGNALDLGAGTGVQSVALTRLGYRVVALDASARLLAELDGRPESGRIERVAGDIRDVATLDAIRRIVDEAGGFDVVVCMGDTLTHLPSFEAVERLLRDVHRILVPGGRLALSFRDLTPELTGTDRFIPVRADDGRVMTCFLEYQADTVTVHDLVHVRGPDGWALRASSYRKLRLAPAHVREWLLAAGFQITFDGPAGRLRALAARR